MSVKMGREQEDISRPTVPAALFSLLVFFFFRGRDWENRELIHTPSGTKEPGGPLSVAMQCRLRAAGTWTG
jgi:hypothetical protein